MGSYYEGLPIYKAAADLVVRLDKVVRCFSRYHKYNLGTRLREKAINVVLLVVRCNRKQERKTAIVQLCNEVEELKILVNLGKEVGAFQSFQQFAQVMEQMVNLARQAEGWKNKILPPITGPEPSRSASVEKRP